MNRWKGKIAVVTGAASGIGEGITKILLNNEINVVGLDINNFHESIKNNQLFFGIKCDLSKSDDIANAFQVIQNKFKGVDILVNNAGVIDYHKIIDSDRETFEKLLNVNVLAFATCIRAAVKSMRDRSVEGHIFNVNSVIGHEIPWQGFSDQPGSDGFNLYTTCKHATVTMTQCVKRELADAKLPIRITSICPGLVKTNLAKNSDIENLFDEITALEPNDVAEALLYALGTQPHVQISELTVQRTGEIP